MEALETLLDMVDSARDEIVQFHQDIVRIQTVNSGIMPTGNEIEVCKYLEKHFSDEDIDFETIESAPTRGNFLASLGAAASPSLLLMSHSDVVPAGDENLWSFPPFSAHIEDGKVYGRGSDDAKSLVTSGAMTLFILNRAGINLQGKLVFLAAADEEAGGTYGAKWLSENVPQKIRTDYALNEGSGSPLIIDGKLAYTIAVGEKGRSIAKIDVHGKAAHAWQPWLGNNAIQKLAEVVTRIGSYTPQIDTSLVFFEQVARLLELEEPITQENLDDIANTLLTTQKDLSSTLRALSRMTMSATLISGGTKSNIIPDTASLTCDIRTLPNQSEAYVEEKIGMIIDDLEDVVVDVEHTAASSMSPPDSSFVNHVKQATEIALGQDNINWIQSIARGFTDSRFVRQIGADAYGFAPLTPDSDPVRRLHSVDEAMEIENLIFRTKMQVALAYLLMGQAE